MKKPACGSSKRTCRTCSSAPPASRCRFRISDVNGVTFGGRRTEWRKAEDHIDRTGQLAYLIQVNEIYEAGITPSSLLLDDVLVSVPLDTTGSGVLPAGATLLAEIVANGPGAATEPLFTYRFRTSRYSSVADWASALSRDAGVLVDPGLPDSLWTGAIRCRSPKRRCCRCSRSRCPPRLSSAA